MIILTWSKFEQSVFRIREIDFITEVKDVDVVFWVVRPCALLERY